MTRLRELVLRGDVMEVVILPALGGRLHRVRAFGVDLLRTPADPATHADDPIFWGGPVMAPWCNRAPAGPMKLAGRVVDLRSNFPDGAAIHGLIFVAPWERLEDSRLAIRRDASDDWPWAFEVQQDASLADASLELTFRLVNLDPEAPMPAGIGLHPWFVQPVAVRVPARGAYRSNTSSSAAPDPVAGDLDLRALAAPSGGLDGTWTDLTEPRIALAWPESGIRATLSIETDAPSSCVAVTTPGDLDAVAVEPQTHGPDPFRRLAAGEPDAPCLLPPGGSLRLTVRLSVERDPGAT